MAAIRRSAQRVACPHGVIPDYQCLHVREVRYDDALAVLTRAFE